MDFNVKENNRGFLGDIAAPIKRYSYQGRKEFIQTWQEEFQRQRNAPPSEPPEWILFTEIDEETFIQNFNFDDLSNPWTEVTWTSYDKIQGLLLVNISIHRPHAVACEIFREVFLEALDTIGIKRELDKHGRATVYGPNGAKNPDLSYIPERAPRGRSDDWPTIVVEVASTETQSKLITDVRFWFGESNGDVNMVTTLTIHQQKPEITIDTWELQNDRPQRTQHLTISKHKNQQRITVSGGSLIIPFESLFLRPPSISRETDIDIDAKKLEYLAS